jgi:hypothetical protein
MLTALFLPFALQAQTLTVCNGTSNNQYIPFYGYNGDAAQHNQMIYPAESLSAMNGETILQMVFYIDPSAQNGTYTAADRLGTWTVSLGETTATTLNGLDSTTTLTQVYQGYFDCSTGTLTLEFDVPYLYNGGNLLVDLNHSAASWNRWYFLGENTASTVAYNSNTSNTYSFLPKCTFAYGNPPTCFKVSNLAIDDLQTTANSLTLTWTDSINSGATYSVYQIEATGETLVESGISGFTYTVNDLDANTAYAFAVMTDCGDGDVSYLTSPVNGRTACAAITTLPYTTGFEQSDLQGSTNALLFPFCWTRINNLSSGSNYYPYAYNYGTPYSGDRHLYFYSSSYGTYADTTGFIMPELDITTYPMNGNRVTFWAKLSGTTPYTIYVGTMSDAADMSTFTLVDSIIVSNSTYSKFIVPLTNANANDPYVAFLVPKVTSSMYIDDLTLEELPSCPDVTGLAVTGITSNSLTLSWTSAAGATGYTVYDTANNVMGTVIDTFYTVTGLAANTEYTFGVQANCTAGDGLTVTVSGRTACDSETMPWSENFNSWTTKSICWSFLRGAYNGGSGTPSTYSSAWTLNSSYGDFITIDGNALTMNVYSTNRYWAITPGINITSDDAMLNVDVAVAGWSSATPNYDADDTLAFAISTDGGISYTSLLVLNNTQLNALGNDYTPINIPVTGYNGQTVRFAIFAGSSASGGDNRIVIDNVSVGEAPSCTPVAGLNVSDITADGATLTWNGNADSYNVYVIGSADTTFDQNVSATTVTLTGLNAMTQYTYGVRAVCNGDESDIRTITFNTACGAITLPYTETFAATSSTRNCWTLVASGNIGGTDGMGFVTVGGREVLRFSSFSNASDYNQYGYSPLMNVSSDASGLMVKVVYATYGNDDQLNFGYVTATDTVWDPTIYTTAGSSDFQNLTFIVPATATQLAVHYYGNYKYYGWIDSVEVTELSGDFCFPVSNLTAGSVTNNSVTLAWSDANNSGATYTVYNMADASVVATNVNATTYTVTGLTAATDYTFGVVADCSADAASETVTVTVTTSCDDIATLPYYEGFENGLGCWTTVNGSSDGLPWNVQGGFGSVTTHSGAGMATSWSWTNNTSMHANAWLISPKIILPNTTDSLTLTWWENANASYQDRYSVVLSTTTNDTAAFTTVVRPYAVGDSVWAIQTVDLTPYAGQSIYLAFHHVDYDNNYIAIDDIALFEGGYVPPAPDTLTVTFAVNDATMGTTVPAPGSYQYLDGDTVFFKAVPNPSYHFTGWIMTANGASDTLSAAYIDAYAPASVLMVYGNLTLTALFEAGNPDSTTITYAVNDATMGTTTPAPGTYTAYVGNSISATATPNAGYQLGAWMIGFFSSTGTNLLTDTILASDPDFANPMNFGIVPQSFADNGYTITVTAVFEAGSTPTQYTVTLNTADANMGTVTPDGATTVNSGASFTATANANDGYHFVAWMSGTTQVSTANPYTFTVTANTTLTATFEADAVEPCDVPTGITATDISGNGATITWDNANVNGWNIQYRTQGANSWSNAASNTNSYTITGLTPSTTYEVQVQADCGNGNTSDWSASYIFTTTTGLDSWLENSVKVFPNPASSMLNVQWTMGNEAATIEILDVYGKLLHIMSVTDEITTINVSDLANGMYFVRVTMDEGTVTKTFVKQ